MSKETYKWLNTNVLVGQTDKRGEAWHYRADMQGDRPNHYPGFIPVEDVKERLFGWEIESRPSYTTIPCEVDDPAMAGIDNTGRPYKFHLLADEQRMMRSDNFDILGPTFKDGYTPHQFTPWLLDGVATILDDNLGITSAGLLKRGAVAWVEVSVPETIESPTGIAFRPNLLASTSCDGSIATSYGRTITCTVCDNTLSAALSEKGQKIKYKHTRYSTLKIGQAREALAMVYTLADDYMAQLEMLDSIKVTPEQFTKFVDLHVLTDSSGKVREWKDLQGRSLTMAENKRDGLMKLYRHDNRVAPWSGSALGVVQCVNTFVHHEGIVRGAERPERNMLSTVTGEFDKIDQATFDMLQSVLV